MDIKKSGVWMTVSESELLQKHSLAQHPALAIQIMEARDDYVAEHPADPAAVDELLTNGVRAAVLKSVDDRVRERLLKALVAELSLDAAKDEVGIELAVIGPLNFSAIELVMLRHLADEAGDEAQEKMDAYSKEMAVPASELDYLGRENQRGIESMLYPDVAAESLVASGIIHAIDAYIGSGDIRT